MGLSGPLVTLNRRADRGERVMRIELIRISASEPARGACLAVPRLPDAAVEIPMVGHGASLNVAVAGSPVLYRLAGLL